MMGAPLARKVEAVDAPNRRLEGESVTGATISRSRLLGVIFLLLVAVLWGMWKYIFAGTNPPREEKLLNTVYTHRTAYERLRDMLLADKQVRAVYARSGVETMESGLPRSLSEVNFPASRYNEYLALLKQIGSTEVFRAGNDNSEICIVVWASGFGGDTRHVDSCWLDQVPVNQVASLDNFYKTPRPRHPVFRHLEGNWYLWADW
jgi:hypothetical protein